ncbi:MAG: DUF3565 domain-containing protein [Planctomycetota bacterium]
MKQPIAAFHQDEQGQWVAELVCGHFRHVRHNPPLESREWVITAEGRQSMLGFELDCKKCDEAAPRDNRQ